MPGHHPSRHPSLFWPLFMLYSPIFPFYPTKTFLCNLLFSAMFDKMGDQTEEMKEDDNPAEATGLHQNGDGFMPTQIECCTCGTIASTSSTKCHQLPELLGRIQVKLAKKPGQQLGLGIAGGSDKSMTPTISYLRPGFIAQRCDQIQVGDRLLAVNGVRVHSELTHSQVLSLLRNSNDDFVELELGYNLNGPEMEAQANGRGIERKTTEIELREEEEEGEWSTMFGMTLRGGAYGPDAQKNRPLTVTAIRVGGAAHREGRLRLGDRVVAVNGVSLVDSTLANALNLIRSSSISSRCLLLTIEYDVTNLGSFRRLPGPILLETEKVVGIDFGIELAIRQIRPTNGGPKRWAIIVRGLAAASMADRCGAVQPGDELLAIDGISLELVGGLAEVYQLLRSQNGTLRLELVPSRGEGRKRHEEDPLRRVNRERLILQREQQQRSGMRSRAGSAYEANGLMEQKDGKNGGRAKQKYSEIWPKHRSASPGRKGGSISARLSTGPGLLGSVSHVENMELGLAQEAAQNWPNFGILLGKQKGGEDEDGATIGQSLVVAQIEKGSPADKCGVLQVGDRILCINDWQTAEGTLEEATHLLRVLSLSGTRSVTLLVEFNLIEPVLPPGPGSLFIVRLAKRGNCLGIVCRSERKNAKGMQQQQKGEPLIISHIRTGSVAHRCGSIQVGDRIHSIDDIPLDACTVEEAMRLLQRSAQIVKLCIAKGGGQEQDLMDSAAAQSSVIYSVELARKGHPLGITIASAGGILDPIVISQLASGGLAERTGALHVGDRILAVNGESLEGKKVGQVTNMLQQCPDPVSIKLCRQMIQNGRRIDEGHFHWPNPSAMNGLPMGICSDENNPSSNAIGPEEMANKIVGTPMKSLDSAMDSLEDSPPDGTQQNVRQGASNGTLRSVQFRPSISNNFQQDLTSGGSSDPYNGGWDSGMSSAAATESQGGGGGGNGHNHHQNNHLQNDEKDKCCGCQLGSTASCSSNSPQSSVGNSSASGAKAEKEDWMQILEALETVGEEEMLKKLEECILTGQASNYGGPTMGGKTRLLLSSDSGVLSKRFIPAFSTNSPPNRPSLMKRPPMSSNQMSKKQQPELPQSTQNAEIQSTTMRRNGGLPHKSNSTELPPPMPSPRAPSAPIPFPSIASTFAPSSSSTSSIPFITSPIENGVEGGEECSGGGEDKFDELSEVFSVQLNRCPLTKSFGFSVCDGGEAEANEREIEHQSAQPGIYIRSVIRDGPAEMSGRIRPGDRILQINGRSIQFLTCDLALPLLATEKVDLLLLRRRQPQQQKRPVRI